MSSDIESWGPNPTDNENQQQPPDGFPEGQTPASLNDSSRNTMAAVHRDYLDGEFADHHYQASVTKTSDTEIKVLGADYTAEYMTDRRIRVTGVGPPTSADGRVVSSTFDATDTVVTVEMDGGVVPDTPARSLLHKSKTIKQAAFLNPGSGATDIPQNQDLPADSTSRNAFINGGFHIWQRGTSFTVANGTLDYTADRWIVTPVGADLPVAQKVPSKPNTPAAFEILLTGATSILLVQLIQRIEAVRIRQYSRIATLSFNIRNDSGAAFFPEAILATANAVNDFSATTIEESAVLQSCPDNADTVVSTTIDLSAFANLENGLQVALQFPGAALNSGTKTVSVTEAQLRSLEWVADFRAQSYEDELIQCRRFFETTFPTGVAPATQAGREGSLQMLGDDGPSGTTGGDWHLDWRFAVPKLAVPTIATYNPVSDNANPYNFTDSGDAASTPQQESVSRVSTFYRSPRGPNYGSDRLDSLGLHFSAESEL